jgi:hypothetical protein
LLFRKEMLTLHWSIMLIHMCSTASARWRLANWGGRDGELFTHASTDSARALLTQQIRC